MMHIYCPESLHSCSNVVKTNGEWDVSSGAESIFHTFSVVPSLPSIITSRMFFCCLSMSTVAAARKSNVTSADENLYL